MVGLTPIPLAVLVACGSEVSNGQHLPSPSPIHIVVLSCATIHILRSKPDGTASHRTEGCIHGRGSDRGHVPLTSQGSTQRVGTCPVNKRGRARNGVVIVIDGGERYGSGTCGKHSSS